MRLESVLASAALVVLIGCKGSTGPVGTTGTPGSDGAAVTSTSLPPGHATCTYGGSEFTSSNATTYACNGAPGTTGSPGADGAPGTSVTAIALAPGADPACPAGGTKFVTGSVTTYACSAASDSTCPLGQALCSGACRRIDVDPANCGACGVSCHSGLCVDSMCAKTVFVTRQAFTGDLGGIAGANAKCQAAASAAGLAGTFKAWLSDGLGGSPTANFTRSLGAYALVNGAIVAKNWSALVGVTSSNSSTFLLYPISLDELGGNERGATVWTGTDVMGVGVGGSYCGNWTSTSGGALAGAAGVANEQWTSASNPLCSSSNSLYCFEQ